MADNLSFYETPSRGDPVALVSVPLELGSDERGFAQAPDHLLKRGLEKMISSIGREVRTRETIACPKPPLVAGAGSMKHASEIAGVARSAAMAVERASRLGNTVVTLGGDHAAAIGTLAGAAAANEKLGIIYIDAHPDCNTDSTTLSGNVHGMVASAAMGFGHPILAELFSRAVAPEDFLFIGIKDVDAAEITFLREHNVPSVTLHEIATRSLSPTIEAIEALSRRVSRVWISMDMDSIDRTVAPGVGMQNENGLSRREALALAHHIGATCDVAGLDVVEILPSRDPEGKTADLALELIARFLGGEWSWYRQQYMQTYKETNVTGKRVKNPQVRHRSAAKKLARSAK